MSGRKSWFRVGTILLVLGLSLVFANESAWSGMRNDYVADELLVQHKAGVPHDRVNEAIRGAGASSVEEVPQIRIRKIKVRPQELEKVKAALARHPHISFVEPNYVAEPHTTPTDTNYTSQWYLPKISAPQAWDYSTGSINVPIAIIDTGVDPTHPDLASKLIPGYNFYAGNTDTHDVYGHGTAVAGSAAAIGNNAKGIAGIAWQNPIMPLVISNSTGYATYSAMAAAITYAVDHGVRIINLSFGGTSSSSTLQNAVTYAWNKGAMVFSSAGNSSTSAPSYPAACTNAIAVSATGSGDTLAGFSNFGTWISIAAPGSSIVSTNNGGGYGTWSGTSFSSPIAAGLAALILSVNPALTNAEVLDIIKNNADDLGTPGFDTSYGYGRINVYRSVIAAMDNDTPPQDTTPPTVSIISPSSGANVSGSVAVGISAADDAGVTSVELYVDGILYATDPVGPFSFVLDTTKYPNGAHILTAKAYDSSGNMGQSSQVSITVGNDKVGPSVSITSPLNGSYIGKRVASVAISISATDNKGVSKMELYIDGVLKSSISGSKMSYSWAVSQVSNGTHTITAKAYDSAGNIGTAMITVNKNQQAVSLVKTIF